ncbi:MAG TPA: ATPase [Bacillota bacterium]|jgi:vacuolar-type H+-ATPase subunit H|nr:ATPase [Bacillota bacterium]HOL10317.1 ATPase [Bacillota bacterium]HPO98093.1 ATPase [Bacillota bacterium]
MSKMNLLVLLERLEELTSDNFQFAGKILIDREEMEELIEKIKIALPEEVKQAEWVSREKERYLLQAQEEAKRIIKEAENYAEELIRQDRILIKAEEEARRIINEAKMMAEDIETEAHNYAHRIMKQLEDNLDRALKIVRQGREELYNIEESN